MSIYTTLWHLQFPRQGDAYGGCEWVNSRRKQNVMADPMTVVRRLGV